jgi:hypothetical protein
VAGVTAWRCSTCGLSYPKAGACEVCGDKTDAIANENPTEDLEAMIALKRAETVFREGEGDKVLMWRELSLLRAGAEPDAARLVAESGADLRRAESMLAAGCDSVTLVEILT